MSQDQVAPARTTLRTPVLNSKQPFLPRPLAGDVLEALTQPFATLEAGSALQARLAAYRQQVSAAIDTVELAMSQNHADYLGGRPSWTYDRSVEVQTRLRILKRQRQHLQEAYGACNRRLKRLQHAQDEAQRTRGTQDATRALAFVQVAQQILAPETLTLLWDAVESQQPLVARY